MHGGFFRGDSGLLSQLTQGNPMAIREEFVHEIRSPRLVAVIWEIESNHGIGHTVTFVRSYHVGNGEWHRTDKLDADELLLAAKLLDQAHTWILNQQTEAMEATP
jgi:hypothetical protein